MCHNYLPGQNLVNMRFTCTKITGPRHEIMLREVPLSTIYTAFTVQSHSQRDIAVNWISMSDSDAPICALCHLVKAKGGH